MVHDRINYLFCCTIYSCHETKIPSEVKAPCANASSTLILELHHQFLIEHDTMLTMGMVFIIMVLKLQKWSFFFDLNIAKVTFCIPKITKQWNVIQECLMSNFHFAS